MVLVKHNPVISPVLVNLRYASSEYCGNPDINKNDLGNDSDSTGNFFAVYSVEGMLIVNACCAQFKPNPK